MILSVFFYIFVACTVIQIIYYISFSSFLFKQKKERKNINEVAVSVIVYTKNNAKKLQKLLPLILDQNYTNFEIVVVNNASIDETSNILENLEAENKNIKVLNVENNEAFWASKKYALTLGIKASTYDYLLFTDDTCKPISLNWISEMSKKFTSKKSIILGYKKYQTEKKFFNILVRFENLLTAIKCFGFTKYSSPFMAYSQNLAYKKANFFKVKGFINHMKINNGIGDLFIKDAYKDKNTTFCISENSFIETTIPTSFSQWFTNKKEEIIITKNYQFKHRFLLSFFTVTKTFFYILAILFFFLYPFKIILSIVLVYFLTQYIVIGISAKKLKEPYILFFLPFLEIILLSIQISIFIANSFSKPKHWR